MNLNRERVPWWVPLTGVLFIALIIVGGAIVGEPPEAKEPVQEIIDHYADNKDAVISGAFVEGLAAAMLIFFAGYLRSVLRAAEGEGHMLSTLALIGATVIAVGAAIDGTISMALAEAVEDDVDPAAIQALQALWDNDFLPFAVGAFVFLISAGLSIVRHGALPAWLGWVAVLLGILTLVPGVIGIEEIGFAGIVGGGLWILVTSVMLTLRARKEPSGTARPAATPGAPGTGA